MLREAVTREAVTKGNMFGQLERLNLVFTKYPVEQLRSLAAGYAEALNDLDLEQVAEAVGLALKEEPRFPAPVKLREYAKRWTQYARPTLPRLPMAQEPTGPQPVCRVCGAMPRLAWLEGRDWKTGEAFHVKRYIAPCDMSRHAEGGVPYPTTFLDWAE